MEQCLAISEIQRIILEGQDDRTKFAFALVAKGFTEVALDSLWEKQKALAPLIKTMSKEGDLWEILDRGAEGVGVPGSDLRPILYFQREIWDTDWERFDYYAARIRHLELEELGRFDFVLIHDSVYAAICTSRPTKATLPNLKKFVVDFDTLKPVKTALWFSRFLHSSITDLDVHIRTNRYREHIDSFLSSVRQKCPNVTRFKTSLWTHTDYSANLENVVRALHHLRKLDCSDVSITSDLVQYLGKLPHLSHLNASLVQQNSTLPHRYPENIDGLFPHLRELVLTNSSREKVVGFLEKLGSPLRSLEIYSYISQKLQACDLQLDQLFRAISRFELLENLKITEYYELSNEIPNSEITAPRFLSHLYGKLSLKILHLSTPMIYKMSKETLVDIACAWPQLRSLVIFKSGWSLEHDFTQNITLEGVMPLLEKCQELETLKLSLNCLPFAPSRAYGKGSMSVKNVHFIASSLQKEHTMQVLRCLAVMFPAATSVQFCRQTEYHEACEEFNALATSFFRFPGV